MAAIVQRRLTNTFSAGFELAELIHQGRGGVAGFDRVAQGIISRRPGAAALELAPGGIVQQIAPLAGNESHEVSALTGIRSAALAVTAWAAVVVLVLHAPQHSGRRVPGKPVGGTPSSGCG